MSTATIRSASCCSSLSKPSGSGLRGKLFNTGSLFSIPQILIGREAVIGMFGGRFQLRTKPGNERWPLYGDARLFAVKRDPVLKFILRYQLFAVIAELVATRDTKVARLQFEHDVGKNAQLEVTAIDAANRSPSIFIPGDKRPPFVGYERQIQ